MVDVLELAQMRRVALIGEIAKLDTFMEMAERLAGTQAAPAQVAPVAAPEPAPAPAPQPQETRVEAQVKPDLPPRPAPSPEHQAKADSDAALWRKLFQRGGGDEQFDFGTAEGERPKPSIPKGGMVRKAALG
ncbi:MAG: hypothetical protein AAGI70_01365 [Pseudomonadota bacterium]